jgi:hypothetical protein
MWRVDGRVNSYTVTNHADRNVNIGHRNGDTARGVGDGEEPELVLAEPVTAAARDPVEQHTAHSVLPYAVPGWA